MFVAFARLEQAQVHTGGVLGKQREIDTATIEMRPERSGYAFVDADHGGLSQVHRPNECGPVVGAGHARTVPRSPVPQPA